MQMATTRGRSSKHPARDGLIPAAILRGLLVD
jgi:hypothetical protein